MSEYGVGADVQQIRVIAVVMITVLPGSARTPEPGRLVNNYLIIN